MTGKEPISLWDRPPEPEPRPHFNGPEYVPERDWSRLTGQMIRVRSLMLDGQWRTLAAISEATGDPPASVSAQLRHLRKARFGSHIVDRRHLGNGLYEYHVAEKEKA